MYCYIIAYVLKYLKWVVKYDNIYHEQEKKDIAG